MLFALQKYGFKWIFPNYVVILWPQEETPLFVENIIMLMPRLYIACLMGLLTLGLLASCKGKKEKMLTPWGEEVGGDDSVSTQKAFTLSDIQNNGELIMLTMSGPETYYDYHGRGMGLQYLLAEKFAQSLGVSLRVEVCRDTLEMVRKLKSGDGDLVAFPCLLTHVEQSAWSDFSMGFLFSAICTYGRMGLAPDGRTMLSGIDVRPSCTFMGRGLWVDANHAENGRPSGHSSGGYL